MAGQVVVTGDARLWLVVKQAGCNNVPVYLGCYQIDPIDVPQGDISFVYCPSPDRPNESVVAREIRSNPTPATTTITGNYLDSVRTELHKLRESKCTFDIQIHLGKCKRLDSYEGSEQIINLQNISLSGSYTFGGFANRNTDPTEVTESATLTIREIDLNFPLTFSKAAENIVAGDLSTNDVLLSVVTCEDSDCEECEPCNNWFAIMRGAETMFAFGENGEISTSTDGGDTWATVVSPTASGLNDGVSDTSGKWVVVGDTGAVVVSSDNATFAAITQTANVTNLNGVATNSDGTYIAVAENGGAIISTDDGATWTALTTGNTNALNKIDYVTEDSRWIAVGDAGTIIYSDDSGATWTVATSNTTENLNDLASDGQDNWVVVGENGATVYSINNGIVWNTSTLTPATTESLLTVESDQNGRWVIGGTTAAIYITSNATGNIFVAPENATAIAGSITTIETNGNGRWLAGNNAGNVYVSGDNGDNWAIVTTVPGGSTINSLEASDVGNAQLLSSYDGGVSWNATDINRQLLINNTSLVSYGAPFDNNVALACWGGNLVGLADHLWYVSLEDLENNFGNTPWTRGSQLFGNAQDVVEMGGNLIGVGTAGYIWSVCNLSQTPTLEDNGVTSSYNDLNAVDQFDDCFAVAVGENGTIVSSTGNGFWNAESSPTTNDLHSVQVHSETEWLVGGIDGLFCTKNGGRTWSKISFYNDDRLIDTGVSELKFVGNSRAFGYAVINFAVLQGTQTVTQSVIYSTTNGGYSWEVEPRVSSAQFVVSGPLNDLAVCDDGSKLIAVGQEFNDTDDGIIIVGTER